MIDYIYLIQITIDFIILKIFTQHVDGKISDSIIILIEKT